jgi:hypothetical protein
MPLYSEFKGKGKGDARREAKSRQKPAQTSMQATRTMEHTLSDIMWALSFRVAFKSNRVEPGAAHWLEGWMTRP